MNSQKNFYIKLIDHLLWFVNEKEIENLRKDLISVAEKNIDIFNVDYFFIDKQTNEINFQIFNSYLNDKEPIMLINKMIFDVIENNKKILGLSNWIYLEFQKNNEMFFCNEFSSIYKKIINKILNIILKPIIGEYNNINLKLNIINKLYYLFDELKQLDKFAEIINNILIHFKNNIESFISLLCIEQKIKEIKNEKNKEKFTIYELIANLFFDYLPNAILLLIDIFVASYTKIENLRIFLKELQAYFSLNIDEYKLDILELIENGEKVINDLFIKNNLSIDNWEEFFLSNENLVNFYNKFHLSKDFFKERFFILIKIFYGYLSWKKLNSAINKRFKLLIDTKDKFKICNFKKWLITNVFKNKKNININKYISDKFWTLPDETEKFHEYCEDKLFDTLLLDLQKFVKDNYGAEYNVDFLKEKIKEINKYYWYPCIYTVYDENNYKLLDKEGLDNFLFSVLSAIDINTSNKLFNNVKKNFKNISKYEKNILENETLIKSTYDKDLARKNIKEIFSKYTEKYNQIDFISLVENNLLSINDRFQFSYYEYIGDLIYNIIINDFKLDCLIVDNIVEISSKNFQEILCESIPFKEYIQKGKFIFTNKEISSVADYFEVFIFWIYKLEGLEKIKKIFLDLINKNIPKILMKKNVKEWIDNNYEFAFNKRLENNNLVIYVPKYYFLKTSKNNLIDFQKEFINPFSKLINSLFKSFIELFLFNEDCNNYVLNSRNFYEDDYSIVTIKERIKLFVETKLNFNISPITFYTNLYHLYKYNFKQFAKYIFKQIDDKNLYLFNKYKLNFHIYEACNMRCKFCFRPKEIEKLNSKWKEAIDLIAKSGKINCINIAGGEPTLNKNLLIEILEYIKSKNLESSIITNGIIFAQDPDFLNEILKYVDTVGISVDSFDPNVNKEIGRITNQGLSMDFYKLKQIEEQVHQSNKKFKVNVVISKFNYNDDSLVKLSKLKIDRLKFLNDQSELNNLTNEDKKSFIKRIIKDIKCHDIVYENNMSNMYLMLDSKLHLSTSKEEESKSIFDHPNIIEELILDINYAPQKIINKEVNDDLFDNTIKQKQVVIPNIAKEIWESYFGNSEYGIDCFGFKIKRTDFANKNSKEGWNIDYIWPKNPNENYSKGSDLIYNKQPLSFNSMNIKQNNLQGFFEINDNENKVIKFEFIVTKNPFYSFKSDEKIGIIKINVDNDSKQNEFFVYKGFLWIKKDSNWFYKSIDVNKNFKEIFDSKISEWNILDSKIENLRRY